MTDFSRLRPDPINTLAHFGSMLENRQPFCFVRFSDGEIEILRNRYLSIVPGETIFRGRKLSNTYPIHDSKRFDPELHTELRRHLLESACYRMDAYYKGIPTWHNNAVDDRDFLVRLNGGMSEFMTFSDLFMNSNYGQYRTEIVPIFEKYEEILVVANHRASLKGVLARATHLPVGDNFFSDYERTLSSVLEGILRAPQAALILSSASSLSNILGYRAFAERKDLTFLDIGTSLNDLLSLDVKVRNYLEIYHSKGLRRLRQMHSRGYQIKW